MHGHSILMTNFAHVKPLYVIFQYHNENPIYHNCIFGSFSDKQLQKP